MKQIFSKRFMRAIAWASVLLCGFCIAGCGKPPAPGPGTRVSPSAAQQTNTATAQSGTAVATNMLAMHRSIFDDSATSGRDPFFPTTTRIQRPLSAGQAKPPEPKLPLSSYLKVTGIWPSKTRPLALINKVILAPGEQAEVPVVTPETSSAGGVQKVQVHCLEIRDRSVLISVSGEPGTKELRMRDQP